MMFLKTLFGVLWRFVVAAVDWRTFVRVAIGRPVVDAVFISNMRDATDRGRFLGSWMPKEGHFNGPRYWLGRVAGRTRALFTVTEDLAAMEGANRAREQFFRATEWAQRKGARVILLAAGTKRLFGEDGAELKRLFPEMVFTIGDNGTVFLLLSETMRAIEQTGLQPMNARVAVLGPYGFLGEIMVKSLKVRGFQVVGAGPNISALERIREKYGIEICRKFSDMGQVDAVVACTHSERIRLTAETVRMVRRTGKKLLIIDVAEPSNFRRSEYNVCRDIVIRQDAGNGYSPRLKYVLGATTYRMFRLSRGVTFGCFAEALCIASALKRGEKVEGIDWFSVNERNMELVAELFRQESFTIPSPRCFSRPVDSFNLEVDEAVPAVSRPVEAGV